MEGHSSKKVAVAGTRRKKRFVPYKWRHITQEQKDLEKWKATYEMVKLTRNQYLRETLQKLRLSKLMEFIKDSLKKEKKRKPRLRVRIASSDSIKKRWQLARQKGNEYSKINKFNTFPIPNLPPLYPSTSKDRLLSAVNARLYGNMISKVNMKKLQYTRQRRRNLEQEFPNEMEILKERRRNLLEYGSYYTMRNRLSLKDECRQFDREYQDLLLKCVAFEKDHIEITGFLEEKFRSNMEFRRGMMALAYEESHKQQDNERKPKRSVLVASPQHTLQVVDEGKIPDNEVFESVTKISESQLVPYVPSDVKTETIVSAVRYASHDQLNNLMKTQKDEQLRATSLLERPTSGPEDVSRISDSVTKNTYFEDTILEIMKSYQSLDSDSIEMQKLLSDLYLAFCMNLMKVAVNEKFIKEEVDIVAVRHEAVKQADAMSQALSEIFRSRSGGN